MRKGKHDGLKKRCGCTRRNWPECSHPWYFNFTWKGTTYRLNLNRLLGRDLEGKTIARQEADRLRIEIRAGRFRAGQEAADSATKPITFEEIGATFIKRFSQAREKKSWHQDELMHARLAATVLDAGGGRTVHLGSKPFATVTADDVEAVLQGVRAAGRSASTYTTIVNTCAPCSPGRPGRAIWRRTRSSAPRFRGSRTRGEIGD